MRADCTCTVGKGVLLYVYINIYSKEYTNEEEYTQAKK